MTPKRDQFVKEYLVDLNATQAAIRAGYSEKTAKSIGQQLLTKLDVQQAITKSQTTRAERTEITQDYVLARLKIESERTEEGSSHAARVSAINLLGKHLGMFVERKELTGADGSPLMVPPITIAFVNKQDEQD